MAPIAGLVEPVGNQNMMPDVVNIEGIGFKTEKIYV